MDHEKQAFMSHEIKPALLEPQGAMPQALALSGGARFTAWCLRCSFLEEF